MGANTSGGATAAGVAGAAAAGVDTVLQQQQLALRPNAASALTSAADAALSKLYPAMGTMGSRGSSEAAAAAASGCIEAWLRGLTGRELAGLQGLLAAEAFRRAAAGDS
jgi:hypothetical protein